MDIPAQGMLRCSRYAFGPNRLHYCGPDRVLELKDRIKEEGDDLGLREILQAFEAMYPYLSHIARANKIIDPLDDRVVEAYWVGNELLDRVSKNDFYWHLIDGLSLKKKFGKTFSFVESLIGLGAVPHHSFHVLDVWKRTGQVDRTKLFSEFDECRVSWGEVVSALGPVVTVRTSRLVLVNEKLTLGEPVERKLTRELEAEYDIEQIKKGDLVSIHWGIICEKLTQKQVVALRKYTLRHITFANLTI